MNRRKVITPEWEDIGWRQTKMLCFSELKGFYVAHSALSEEIRCQPHGYKGYYNGITVEEKYRGKNFKICIKSNFGYGNLAYLRASIECDG